MTPPTSQDDCHSANRRIGNDNSCHCEERSDVAIRSPSGPRGTGRCFAPQGMRIATSGFALLAMTAVIVGERHGGRSLHFFTQKAALLGGFGRFKR